MNSSEASFIVGIEKPTGHAKPATLSYKQVCYLTDSLKPRWLIATGQLRAVDTVGKGLILLNSWTMDGLI